MTWVRSKCWLSVTTRNSDITSKSAYYVVRQLTYSGVHFINKTAELKQSKRMYQRSLACLDLFTLMASLFKMRYNKCSWVLNFGQLWITIFTNCFLYSRVYVKFFADIILFNSCNPIIFSFCKSGNTEQFAQDYRTERAELGVKLNHLAPKSVQHSVWSQTL